VTTNPLVASRVSRYVADRLAGEILGCTWGSTMDERRAIKVLLTV
jgi:hypothetical protein